MASKLRNYRYVPTERDITFHPKGRGPYTRWTYTQPPEFWLGDPEAKNQSFYSDLTFDHPQPRNEAEALRAVGDILDQWQRKIERRDTPTVVEALETWRTHNRKRASNERLPYRILPMQEYFQQRLATCITGDELDAYCDWRRDGNYIHPKFKDPKMAFPSEDTLNFEATMILGAIHLAEDQKRLPENYIRPLGYELPEKVPRELFLDHEQEAKFFDFCEDLYFNADRIHFGWGDRQRANAKRFAMVAMLILEAGGRSTVTEKIQWSQIILDPPRGKMPVIHLHPPGQKKTSKTNATVPMSNRIQRVLRRAWLERDPNSNWPYLLDDIRSTASSYKSVMKMAGIPHMSRHGLRATFATLSVMGGVPLEIVADWLGDSYETTKKHYAKYVPDDPIQAALINRRHDMREALRQLNQITDNRALPAQTEDVE